MFLVRQLVSIPLRQDAHGHLHQSEGGPRAGAAVVAVMVSASLGDQLEGRAIVTLEAIGPEDIGILPGARTVRRVEVEQDAAPLRERSEEHTSELQSLMRISYAVFCLKKKTSTDV